ncbi:DoxX family membrane protein [Cellulomonas bogoriensis]|uniref:DoxX family protein n=1 Tax=Cellulomonas bogoriensis 69B4 = DSM 16987 TaxID=1386082 RepID=A0A0A0C293_9CELL|nr:DoxX family membrane protein [Cellulomonas bogoriensis]KGM13519.1 DoxX family protein [Cellulomonas bogoriensis 69B4 = DSM 16987]
MLVRRIARPLLATVFVAEGVDALRHPQLHVDRAEAAWNRLQERAPLPAPPDRETLRTVVRLHGAAMTGAAALLALGRAPRLSGLALAALTLPVAVMNQPFVARRGADAADRRARRERFVRTLSMLGGALLAAVDTQGRPGLAWRVSHARPDHAARDARKALGSAAKDVRKHVS